MHEASQEQLFFAAAFLGALPQAALLLDPGLRVVRVNRRLTTLLRLPEELDLSPGTPRERIVGHLAGMLDRPEERDRLLEESETHGPSPAPPTTTCGTAGCCAAAGPRSATAPGRSGTCGSWRT
ncbi:hypothetical protein [Streptomyces sp. NPDC052494]|uniref:hypothetical protein n=1 Tax=Streptomyces sp. NPDC052494 TaxID=3365692 RepID=UPI0037D37896